jgi:hypothetical protein
MRYQLLALNPAKQGESLRGGKGLQLAKRDRLEGDGP